jgi:hypothetical protein
MKSFRNRAPRALVELRNSMLNIRAQARRRATPAPGASTGPLRAEPHVENVPLRRQVGAR